MNTALDYPSNDQKIMKRHEYICANSFISLLLGHFGGYRHFSSSLVKFKKAQISFYHIT